MVKHPCMVYNNFSKTMKNVLLYYGMCFVMWLHTSYIFTLKQLECNTVCTYIAII